jgi:fructose-bisphosphate aldolase class II
MLVSSRDIILKAQRESYAVGAFNTSDLEITKAIILAAERMRSPVIVETTEHAIGYAGLENIAEIVKTAAENSSIPVALHLDHGTSIERIKDCIAAGYTSVMFDGSYMPYEENIKLTSEAVKIAHANNIPCEGELGSMGKVGFKESEETDPFEVKEFIDRTSVDFLAVSIGSTHGIDKEEKLNIELLKEIRQKTDIPLVLHGSSGVSDEDIKLAISEGISKINVDTDIRFTFIRELRKVLEENPDLNDPRSVLNPAIRAVEKLVENRIKLFGSADKA